MAITWAASLPAVGANNGGNVTLTFSNFVNAAGAGYTLVTGDIVVAAYACSGTADHVMSTMSAGWTLLAEHYANGTIDTNIAVFGKVMGATPDTSIALDGPGGNSNGTIAVAHVIKGADISALDVAAVTAEGSGTSVPNPGAVTPATAGAWIAVVGAGAAAAGATFGHTDLASTTNHFRTGNHAETNDIAIGFGWKEDWASGAFDPAVWTGGNVNASNTWAALTLAIKPVAAVSHATSGAMTGQLGSVAGSAAHVAIHTSTGALTGQLGAVAGAASSATARPSSGALVGPGSTVAGSVARTRAHATSGILAGIQASVAGSAARSGAVTHETDGAISGPGASVTGSAARAATHDASGDLAGVGAVIAAMALSETWIAIAKRSRRRRHTTKDYRDKWGVWR